MRRLTRQLAMILLAGEWSRVGLIRRLSLALGFSGSALRAIANDLLAEFPVPLYASQVRLAAAIAEHREFLLLAAQGLVPTQVLRWPVEPLEFRPGVHPVPALAGSEELCRFLDLPRDWLDWFVDLKGLERTARDPRLEHYCRVWIPKASGGSRLIEAPKQRLKNVQRRILGGILDRVAVHPAAHGCVSSKSAITHARLHQGRKTVVQLDLSSFFATISCTRIAGFFSLLGYPRATARMLAALCTTSTPDPVLRQRPPARNPLEARHQWEQSGALQRRHLPQGAPTSPALANLVAWGLDTRLAGLSERLGCTYSRYVDDLAFSSDGPLNLASFVPMVRRIVEEEGFVLNRAKTRVQRRHQQQRVTGLVVNERASTPRKDFDRLRATLHQARLRGPPPTVDVPAWRDQVRGQIAWVAASSPTRGAKLRRAFDAIP